jgi:hypothetical protein
VRREVYVWRMNGYAGASATLVCTRQDRELELRNAWQTHEKPGRYVIAVKVIDIFGNDTMTLMPVTVG